MSTNEFITDDEEEGFFFITADRNNLICHATRRQTNVKIIIERVEEKRVLMKDNNLQFH